MLKKNNHFHMRNVVYTLTGYYNDQTDEYLMSF